MAGLIECVPNFSEGRRPTCSTRCAAPSRTRPASRCSTGPRTRTTTAACSRLPARPTRWSAAALAASAVAISRIDLRSHQGQHPRIGAIDVVPFVPLEGSTMDECVAIARGFGQRLADGPRPAGVPLRRGSHAARAAGAQRHPQAAVRGAGSADRDARPISPTSVRRGATRPPVPPWSGARPFLIAYNINLESDDLALAKQIASTIRERNGGLPRVQALGLFLDDLGCAQVSMNLLDFSVTPIWRVWEEVERLAGEAGVGLRESELIGLAPVAALTAVADHCGVAAVAAARRTSGAGGRVASDPRLRSDDGARAAPRGLARRDRLDRIRGR